MYNKKAFSFLKPSEGSYFFPAKKIFKVSELWVVIEIISHKQ